ncbi:hypothetical protein AAG747_11080 [Rapidithrix thailandica]|uniref:SseB protein N-terminal domain-containing protein n=1 Tax=Rapidithrix thailandica TaxID=413964 RepID=A0AAW9RZR0_9BACT
MENTRYLFSLFGQNGKEKDFFAALLESPVYVQATEHNNGYVIAPWKNQAGEEIIALFTAEELTKAYHVSFKCFKARDVIEQFQEMTIILNPNSQEYILELAPDLTRFILENA